MKIFSVLLLLPILAQASPVQSQGIYGEDDRRELYELQTDFQRNLSDASVALFPTEKLRRTGDTFRIEGSTYGEEQDLCPAERFFDQPASAFCSGILVGPDLVLTAGHCITSQRECHATKFVFGYALKAEGQNPQELLANDVYDCKKIVSRELTPGNELPADGADYALIKLSRAVTQHSPVEFAPTGGPRQGETIIAFGYPSGLPMKFITSAQVREGDQSTFRTNLDTYAGNSGSPVVNLSTGKLEGLLIEGDVDFERSPAGCRISKVCPDDGCMGERVMRVDEILKRIAQAKNNKN